VGGRRAALELVQLVSLSGQRGRTGGAASARFQPHREGEGLEAMENRAEEDGCAVFRDDEARRSSVGLAAVRERCGEAAGGAEEMMARAPAPLTRGPRRPVTEEGKKTGCLDSAQAGLRFFFAKGGIILKLEHSTSPQSYTQDPIEK
jgi:hypothetical protein